MPSVAANVEEHEKSVEAAKKGSDGWKQGNGRFIGATVGAVYMHMLRRLCSVSIHALKLYP